jgi:hypothetical protein
MKTILIALVAIVVAGCSAGDSNVTVGEPGQKGIVRTDIDRSKSVAQDATDRVSEGNKDLGDSQH